MIDLESWLELAGATLMKPSGDGNIIARCPFHDDRKRSFSINTVTGQYICFSESCGAQGGIFSFLTKGCGFSRERAQKLAIEFGASAAHIPSDGSFGVMPTWGERHVDKSRVKIQERILGAYEFCPEDLLDRGFKRSVLKRWEVGYDFEAKRVTFAVRDEKGRLVGMTKRATLASQEEKYLHLEFAKSTLLYGAHLAPKARTAYVGEGQTDAIALDQMGAAVSGGVAVVSTMGSRVSRRQIELLMRYPHVVLAFDNPATDRDGRRVTERVGAELSRAGRRVDVLTGYPEGVKDPAQLLERGHTNEERLHFMRHQVPFLQWSLMLEPMASSW